MENLKERLKAIRKHTGLNQADFATKIGVSARSVSSYEKDPSKITMETLHNIANICNVNEVWLLTGQGEMIAKEVDYKKASNGSDGDTINFKDVLIAEHYEIIKQFRDNERAKRFNQKLVKLESLSDGLFNKAEVHVDQLIETAEIVVEEKSSKQPGRGAGKVKRRKKA